MVESKRQSSGKWGHAANNLMQVERVAPTSPRSSRRHATFLSWGLVIPHLHHIVYYQTIKTGIKPLSRVFHNKPHLKALFHKGRKTIWDA